MICLFHKWVRVEDAEHSVCGQCFSRPNVKGFCPHSFKVCSKCGKAVGYGSHGKLTVVPDGCKAQVLSMGGKV